MPTYEYQCLKCGHRFDHFQSITAEPLKYCVASECIFEDVEKRGEGEVKRIVSGGAGLVFKGEGFYLTDYARKGNGGESGSSAASGNGDSGSSASKESSPQSSSSSSGDSSGSASAKASKDS